ncbi:MAG: hypothetical protein ACQEQC_07315 [Elusimicrobiota bacterium]
MFKKEEYINYFESIIKIENKMLKNAEELKKIISDPECLKMLDDIIADENNHAHMEEEIVELIKKM